MKLHLYLGGTSDYILIVVVCFFVGLFFTHGMAHGASISAEVILLYMAILFMIGRPMSAPLSDILKVGIISPLLPFIPTGLFAGFVGGQIRKNKKRQR
jgi:pheromone shutdown protein TraB